MEFSIFAKNEFTEMNRRLEQFLAAENISQAQFADTIGVARASISHILAGRNKPGYDFIVSTALHYPILSLDWLLCGKGKMYRGDVVPLSERILPSSEVKPDFGSDTAYEAESSSLYEDVGDMFGDNNPASLPEVGEISKDEHLINNIKTREISKIVLFYSDGSFEEFQPK